MITLFISFHYACLFISKHLWLVALFASAASASFPHTPPLFEQLNRHSWRHLAHGTARGLGKKKLKENSHNICAIFHKQLAKLAKFS